MITGSLLTSAKVAMRRHFSSHWQPSNALMWQGWLQLANTSGSSSSLGRGAHPLPAPGPAGSGHVIGGQLGTSMVDALGQGALGVSSTCSSSTSSWCW